MVLHRLTKASLTAPFKCVTEINYVSQSWGDFEKRVSYIPFQFNCYYESMKTVKKEKT